jgi:hypothetical protein
MSPRRSRSRGRAIAPLIIVWGGYRDQKLVEGTVPAADFYSSALVDQINRFDKDAVIRQAKEYKF